MDEYADGVTVGFMSTKVSLERDMELYVIVSERIGKGIRAPATDAILSHATKQVGRGLRFRIHEALDKVGAIIGPLIFSAVFIVKYGYRRGFIILWIPALLCIAVLLVRRRRAPSPVELEVSDYTLEENIKDKGGLPRVFWLCGFLFFFINTSPSFLAFAIKFHLINIL